MILEKNTRYLIVGPIAGITSDTSIFMKNASKEHYYWESSTPLFYGKKKCLEDKREMIKIMYNNYFSRNRHTIITLVEIDI